MIPYEVTEEQVEFLVDNVVHLTYKHCAAYVAQCLYGKKMRSAGKGHSIYR